MNSTITLKIELDENKIPENIKWSAPDGGVDHEETKAFLLSIWDHQQKETLKTLLQFYYDYTNKYNNNDATTTKSSNFNNRKNTFKTREKAASFSQLAREITSFGIGWIKNTHYCGL